MSGSGVDLQMLASLDYGDQIYGTFEVAFNASRQQFARIIGTEGIMTLDWPFNQGNKRSLDLVEHGDDRQDKLSPVRIPTKTGQHFYQVAVLKENHFIRLPTRSKIWS